MDRIRISVSALCRLESKGKLLLGTNKNRKLAGLEVLTPIGGAIEIRTAGEKKSLEDLGAEWEEPGQWRETGSLDLRFRLPRASLPALERWLEGFSSADEEALRELQEELAMEYSVVDLDSIKGSGLHWARAAGLWRHVEEAATQRTGVEGFTTRRYSFVSSITVPVGIMSKLEGVASQKGGCLAWASPGEIRAGWLADGRPVGSNARALLGSD